MLLSIFIFTANKNLFYKNRDKLQRQRSFLSTSLVAKDSRIIEKGTSGLDYNIAHSRSIRITTSNLYVTAHILYSDIRHRTGHKWNYILIIYNIYNLFIYLFFRELYFMYVFIIYLLKTFVSIILINIEQWTSK